MISFLILKQDFSPL
uniref:Uncharacterized protein n=1 Tax=Anguilla anguilla TaxID=7936 RepID=A0A0E9QAI1_ANGAN